MVYGLIGEHLGHSFSKEIHERLSGRPYELREVPRGELGTFLGTSDFRGVNVTIPYKRAVLPFLDYVSPEAEAIGAVNTIVRRDGKLCGYNTDFSGFTALAARAGIDFRGRSVLVLGGGGAARTVAAASRSLGATSVVQAVRNPSEPGQLRLDDPGSYAGSNIIVNATPVGMFPDGDSSIVCPRDFPRLEGVLDCVYNPLSTNLVLDARECGARAEGGLYMLVAQACRAQELFRDVELTQAELDAEYIRLLAAKTNIVLCGMPSSGKTTIGRMMAAKFGREFVDTDELVVKKSGMTIKEIFAGGGESAFRTLEREAVAEVSARQGLVVATGGGCVMDYGNVRRLRRNGILVLLKRSQEHLAPSDDRPLSSSGEALERLYRERMPVYEKISDLILDNDKTPEELDLDLCLEKIKGY